MTNQAHPQSFNDIKESFLSKEWDFFHLSRNYTKYDIQCHMKIYITMVTFRMTLVSEQKML